MFVVLNTVTEECCLLLQDVSFVADCTTAIIDALEDSNMSVKVKAAWSLANLGDAVASNR